MRAVLILALTMVWTPAAAQTDKEGELRLRAIAQVYRNGDTEAALKMLGTDDIRTQLRAVRTALAAQSTSDTWTLQLLRAAGALHMEQALALYERGQPGDDATVVVNQISIGELLLDEVARLENRPNDAVRWEWAIAQQAMADGHFRSARSIMFRACDRYPAQPRLLLACGTLHESDALSSIDPMQALRGLRPISGANTEQEAQIALRRIRRTRSEDLSRAADLLTEVRRLDPSSLEASLRLGHVRLQQGDSGAAAAILGQIVDSPADRRLMYLSRLFLGRAFERQERTDVAISIFRGAVAVLPAQSARLSLSRRLHAIGQNDEARRLAESAAADDGIDDPWWSYRFGEYWLVGPTLQALREEARR